MRVNSAKMEELQKANAELKEQNSVQARSEKMAGQVWPHLKSQSYFV